MCFDPDTCPLSKAEEYLDHYRGCIRIYNGAVQTLERRIAEEGVGTSAKQHAISQKQKGEDDESENDDSEDGGNENGESEDTESDDAAGNSDVKRVNNDDESDEDEDAKTISAEPRGVEVAESKEAKAETESRAGAETEVGESSDAQRFNNEKNEDAEDVEINPELLDEYDNMRRLVTPLINYIDQDRMPPVSRNIACWRFIERLRNFKYLDWKNIDPTKLEYIMTPAIVGNPGCHYPRRRARVRSESEVYSDADADFSDNGLSPGIKQIFQQEWDNFKQSHAGDGKFMHECRRKSNLV
ncbi:hypothetical protein P8452_69449 [Trifolium repens]|nr:hypothetical protein P8452_69449 [Trifolium repens]